MRNHHLFRRFLIFVLLCTFLLLVDAGSPVAEASSPFLVTDKLENGGRIESLIAGMSLHEKVCQLFFLQPEQFSMSKLVCAPDEILFDGRIPVSVSIRFLFLSEGSLLQEYPSR